VKIFLNGDYLAKLQARTWLSHMHFVRLATTLLKDEDALNIYANYAKNI